MIVQSLMFSTPFGISRQTVITDRVSGFGERSSGC